MGFSKNKVAKLLKIAFSVELEGDNGELLERASVVHKFRRPSIKEREAYRQAAHRWDHGKPKLAITKANLLLWDACIESVEGYDDLDLNNPKWKDYFLSDDIGKEHADAAARLLMDKISESEEELEKKSDL